MDRRHYFTSQLEHAAAACGAALRWLSDGWVAQLTKDGCSRHVIGYTFPLNDAAAAHLAIDKTAACAVLGDCRIPAIPHHVMRLTLIPPEKLTVEALGILPLPLVAKPNTEGDGIDVLRARDEAELQETMNFLAQRYRSIALSPYVDIAHEYRVVVLDEEVRIIFEKKRNADWRHNLRGGALPQLIDPADAADAAGIVIALSILAQQAMRALNLRFASVDIVEVHGRLAVLEVNSAVILVHFSAHAPAHAELASSVYRDAVAACFADTASR